MIYTYVLFLVSAKAREEWKAPMKEIDAALIACTFGRFQIKLLGIAFVGFMAGILASSTTAYLLPSAECDLKMDLLQKGLLNAMPYIGKLNYCYTVLCKCYLLFYEEIAK